MSIFGNKDFVTEVARGKVAGMSILTSLGENGDIDVVTAGTDIWRGGELTPAPTSTTSIPTPPSIGEQMSIVSEDAADTKTSGTGAWTVEVHYLDGSGLEQTEIVDMAGLSAVDLVASDVAFVNEIHVLTAGGGLVTAGHIKIYQKADSGLVYSMIAAGGNMSLVPQRKIPSNKHLILKGWHASESKGKRVVCRIRSTDNDGILAPNVFLFKGTASLNKMTTGELVLERYIPSDSIVKVSGWADQNDSSCAVGFWGILIDN